MEPHTDPQEPFGENLDLGVMDQLLNLDDGALGLLKEMLGLFKTDTPDRIRAIEATLASGDLADMADLAHAIKGASANVGAVRVASVAREMEDAALDADWDALGTAMRTLSTETESARKALSAQ